MQNETGKSSVPLTLNWLQGQPPKERLSESQGQKASENTQSNGSAGLFPSAGSYSGSSGVSSFLRVV